ncbi:MAG: hypothetical protein KM310_08920, partial [Clostridiales bacterium]|nr:hypothetical protein [Clostridiales bacterium]
RAHDGPLGEDPSLGFGGPPGGVLSVRPRAGRAVRQALDEGDYAKAKALWKPVDQVIHAVYPTLQKKNGPLARDMWHHMALVELGFMSGDWEKARQGAEALPSILKKVEAELGGMSVGP